MVISGAYLFGPVSLLDGGEAQYLKSPPLLETQSRAEPPQYQEAVAVIAPQETKWYKAQTYVTKKGDSISSVAAQFGINTETIVWANELNNPNSIKVGQELKVPPVEGVLYTVKKGDTVSAIAKTYGVEMAAVLDYPGNEINAGVLQVGNEIMVPGGVKKAAPAPPKAAPAPSAPLEVAAPKVSAVSGSGFLWPTYGPITTHFSGYHPGIDIAPPWGTPVYAAVAGKVVDEQQLGWSYGWYIILDHGNGVRTQYSHLSKFLVGVGEWVEQGQAIALTGNTGRSSGPHLDFRIYVNGQEVNPLNYLP